MYVGMYVEITTVGTTSYTAVGAPNNNVGTDFIATGVATGTGTIRGLPQNTFTVRATSQGSAINTTTAGSGVHTGTFNMLGVPEWGGATHLTKQSRRKQLERHLSGHCL